MGIENGQDPIPITDVPPSVAESQRPRIRRYVMQMTIRVVCFVLAFFFEGWVRGAFFVAAAVLPYLAVVIANAGPTRRPVQTKLQSPQRLIEGRPDQSDPDS